MEKRMFNPMLSLIRHNVKDYCGAKLSGCLGERPYSELSENSDWIDIIDRGFGIDLAVFIRRTSQVVVQKWQLRTPTLNNFIEYGYTRQAFWLDELEEFDWSSRTFDRGVKFCDALFLYYDFGSKLVDVAPHMAISMPLLMQRIIRERIKLREGTQGGRKIAWIPYRELLDSNVLLFSNFSFFEKTPDEIEDEYGWRPNIEV